MNQIGLSLTDGQREALAQQGVTIADGGGLQSRSGALVSLGTAVAMLAKAGPIAEAVESAAFSRSGIREGQHLLDHDGIEPGNFDRGYLREGHAAERPQLLGGVPFASQGVQARPDASDGLHREDVDLDEVDGGDVAKRAVVPLVSRIRRRYLTQDHQADSPANTGRANTPHIPGSRPAEPEDYHRSYLAAGHADPSPGDRPPNNPCTPATPGSVVYQVAEAAYMRNRAQARADQLMPTGAVSSQPAPAQWSPPAGLGATEVPSPLSAAGLAPGER